MDNWMELMLEEMLLDLGAPDSEGLRLHWTFSSMMEFYAQSQVCTSTGDKRSHETFKKSIAGQNTDYRWRWAGIPKIEGKSSLEILMSRKFAYREGIEEIDRESRSMVQGYRRKIYKWNELDGDDLDMERLKDHLPAMRKREYTQGDKFGNYISLYFNICVNAGVTPEEMAIKTKTAVKLIKFFESLGKRVEVVIFSKTNRPGSYNGQMIKSMLLEINAKKFSDPLNISLLNTALSTWMLRYWEFLFVEGRIKSRPGRGQAATLNKETDFKKRRAVNPIIIDSDDCLNKEESDEFIQNVLKNQEMK